MPDDSTPARLLQRVRHCLPITLVLIGTAVLYTWNLAVNLWGNSFYSAAIWSGSQNFEAAFFGSLDPGNAISVDKPPASLWLSELSVKVFGFHPWATALPSAILGVATVWMVYATVRRVADRNAALFGAVATALTPVAALMFRYQNPDALLVFLLVTAGYATIRATEKGSRRWLVLAGGLIGLAVLTKMLQAGLIVPVLGAVYLYAAPGTVKRRIVDLLYAAGAIAVGCGWWFAAVLATPASHRPFIDGTDNNSIVDLVFGYNGLGRLTGGDGNQTASGGGPLRLFNGAHHDGAAMVSWLLPAAVLLAVVALVIVWKRPRTDALKITLLIGAGSLAISAAFFSFMGGIYKDYYTVALTPWIGITIGVAASVVGRRVLAVALAITAVWAWHVLDKAPMDRFQQLGVAVLIVGAVVGVALLVARGRFAAALLAVAAVLALAGPAAYALKVPAHSYQGATPIVLPAGGMEAQDDLPYADCKPFPGVTLQGVGYGTTPAVPARTADLLRTAAGAEWSAATIGSERAAGLELATQTSVMALGGYKAKSPGMTLEHFQQLVRAGKIRYFVPVCVWPGKDPAVYAIQKWVWDTHALSLMDGMMIIDLRMPKIPSLKILQGAS